MGVNQQLLRVKSSLGSFSNDDVDAEDDALSKMNLDFTSEIRNCLDLFGTPMALKPRPGKIFNDSV